MNPVNLLAAILLIALASITLISCGNSEELERLQRSKTELSDEKRELEQKIEDLMTTRKRIDFLAGQMDGIKATIVTNHGDIELAFHPDRAPIHTFNFVTRAESGFSDGTKFHRVIPGFMIQGGDPNSREDDRRLYGQGGPVVAIPHEFNDTRHEPGILSMARVSDKSRGAGSQFFIMHGANPGLDNEYTAFGEVTSGMDVVDAIANVQTSSQYRDQPEEHVVIERVEVFR